MGTVWVYTFKHFLNRWNVIIYVHPVCFQCQPACNKAVFNIENQKVLALHLTSFYPEQPLLLSLPPPTPFCGNVIQVWSIHRAQVKRVPYSNQILPSHSVPLLVVSLCTEYHIAAKLSQWIYIITGKAVWDEWEIQLGRPPVTRDQCSPLWPQSLQAGSEVGTAIATVLMRSLHVGIAWSVWRPVNTWGQWLRRSTVTPIGTASIFHSGSDPQGQWPSPLLHWSRATAVK